MDHLCYLFFVFVMFSCLLIAALWSFTGKELTYWLNSATSIWCFLCSCHFPMWCLGSGLVLDCS